MTDTAVASEPLLRLDGLTTTFRTPRGRLRAVDGVSLQLGLGETVGIVGESGSGKSVLVRSVMDLLPPTAELGGQVTFDGRNLRELPKADRKHLWGREIAMVFQDPMTSLNPVKTIGKQLTDPIRYHLRLSRADARVRALELLSLVRIPEPERRLKQYPHELSGGMRQRAMIAIAVSCDPKLLIADEPTTALDVTVQKQILDLIGRIQQELGMSVILITHDLGVVADHTTRVYVMYAGRVVEQADTSVLFSEMRHPYTRALMDSIPKVELDSHTRLAMIPGRPPDMVNPPDGCRFAPRCSRAQPECTDRQPQLVAEGTPGHRFACFHPLEPSWSARPSAEVDAVPVVSGSDDGSPEAAPDGPGSSDDGSDPTVAPTVAGPRLPDAAERMTS
jgi:peptide/nickel transport system ATP-binding protein